jgi:BolA protein
VSVADEIRTKLIQGLSPIRLDIVDESHLHVGHSGAPEGGESHFRVSVVSGAFDGISRIQRQRMVYRLLESELQGAVHALSIITRTPAEDQIQKSTM